MAHLRALALRCLYLLIACAWHSRGFALPGAKARVWWSQRVAGAVRPRLPASSFGGCTIPSAPLLVAVLSLAAAARATAGNHQRSLVFGQVGGGAQRVLFPQARRGRVAQAALSGWSSKGQASEALKVLKEPPFFPKEDVKICMVGSTGSGKSALANFLFNPRRDDYYEPQEQKFKTGEDQRSCTSKCETKTVEGLSIMDTPGLNESAKKDFQHMLHVVKSFASCGELHVVILVMKFESRMDTQWKQTVQAYQKLLGEEIFDRNLILVLTGFDPSSPKYRSAHVGRGNVERIMVDNANAVKDLLRLRCAPLIWAIDSMPDPEKTNVVAKHEQTRNEILKYSSEQNPVSVKGVKVPKTKEVQQADLLEAEKLEGKLLLLQERFERLASAPQGAKDEVVRLEGRRQSILEEVHRVESQIKALDTDDAVIADQCTSSGETWFLLGDSTKFHLDAPERITKTTCSVSKGAELRYSKGGEGAMYFEGEIVKTGRVSLINCEVKIFCRKKDLEKEKLEKLRRRLSELNRDVDEVSSKMTDILARCPDLEKPLFELEQEMEEKRCEVSILKGTHLTIPEAERRLRQT